MRYVNTVKIVFKSNHPFGTPPLLFQTAKSLSAIYKGYSCQSLFLSIFFILTFSWMNMHRTWKFPPQVFIARTKKATLVFPDSLNEREKWKCTKLG